MIKGDSDNPELEEGEEIILKNDNYRVVKQLPGEGKCLVKELYPPRCSLKFGVSKWAFLQKREKFFFGLYHYWRNISATNMNDVLQEWKQEHFPEVWNREQERKEKQLEKAKAQLKNN
jgi:hypothetical protein